MEPAFHLRSFIGTFDEHWHDDPMHRNTTLEIEIILEGRGRFEWEDRSVQVETGHVVIIPPGIPHRFDAVTNIRFGVIHLQHMPSSLQDVANQLGAALQRPTISALSRMDRDRFELLFRELLRHIEGPAAQHRCMGRDAAALLVRAFPSGSGGHNDYEGGGLPAGAPASERKDVRRRQADGHDRRGLPPYLRENLRHQSEAVSAALPHAGGEVAPKRHR